MICVINSSWLAGSFAYAKSRTQAPSTFWFCHCLDLGSPLCPVVERERRVAGTNCGPDMTGLPSVLLLLAKTSLMSLSGWGGGAGIGKLRPQLGSSTSPQEERTHFWLTARHRCHGPRSSFSSASSCAYPLIFLLFYQSVPFLSTHNLDFLSPEWRLRELLYRLNPSSMQCLPIPSLLIKISTLLPIHHHHHHYRLSALVFKMWPSDQQRQHRSATCWKCNSQTPQ